MGLTARGRERRTSATGPVELQEFFHKPGTDLGLIVDARLEAELTGLGGTVNRLYRQLGTVREQPTCGSYLSYVAA